MQSHLCFLGKEDLPRKECTTVDVFSHDWVVCASFLFKTFTWMNENMYVRYINNRVSHQSIVFDRTVSAFLPACTIRYPRIYGFAFSCIALKIHEKKDVLITFFGVKSLTVTRSCCGKSYLPRFNFSNVNNLDSNQFTHLFFRISIGQVDVTWLKILEFNVTLSPMLGHKRSKYDSNHF